MRLLPLGLMAVCALAACDTGNFIGTPDGVVDLNRRVLATDANRAEIARFSAVVSRLEPVAEAVCRREAPRMNCDFTIIVDTKPDLPANAFQTLDGSNRPIIGFTVSLIEEMRNDDELAFALAHEAAHHIENHIPQTQTSAAQGALIGAVLATRAGLDEGAIQAAEEFGGTVGARRFSKEFELEADAMGALIAAEAGFDPLRGVLYFQRAPDPGDRFLGTHPPNAQRIQIVREVAGGL